MYLCPNNNRFQEATQECFDRYPLLVTNTKSVQYSIPNESKKQETFIYKVKLPTGVTCSQCVIQWTYYTGNMWGTCRNGTEGCNQVYRSKLINFKILLIFAAVGCGPAETFRNCADVSVYTSAGSGRPPLFVEKQNPFLLYYRDYRVPNPQRNVFPLIIR